MTGIAYSFEKLKVWQEAKKLVVDVYHLLDNFPKFEKYASLMETYNQLLIAIELTYITEESVEAIKPSIDAVAKMINGLSNSYEQKLEEQASTKQLNK